MSLFSDYMSVDMLLIFSVKCTRSMNIRAKSGDVNKTETLQSTTTDSVDLWLLWDTLGQVGRVTCFSVLLNDPAL